MPAYLATVLPGLEGVAASEIQTKAPDAILKGTPRGKVLFVSAAPPARLLALRTADDLYVLAGRFAQGPYRTHLADLEREVSRLDVGGALHVASWLPRARPAVFVNASRSGKQTYSRFEAADAALRGLLARHPRWSAGSAEAHDLEFRVDVAGDEALLSLRLSPPGFRFRGQTRAFAPAALRPPVAHALVWLSDPRPDDRFVDPFCGSGTILAERAVYPARQVIGGDILAEALQAARENLEELGRKTKDERRIGTSQSPSASLRPASCILRLLRWDSRRLPLRAGSVDKLVTNLPFGKQVLGEAEIGDLYVAFFAEARRVLARGGAGILLTDQEDALRRAVARAGLQAESLAALSLKGLHPQVWRVVEPGNS